MPGCFCLHECFNIMKFFESIHCTSKVHCKTCRAIHDTEWRQSIVEAHEDLTELNFPCPYKIPWNADSRILNKPMFQNDPKVAILRKSPDEQLKEILTAIKDLDEAVPRNLKLKKTVARIVKETKKAFSECSPCQRGVILHKVLVYWNQFQEETK